MALPRSAQPWQGSAGGLLDCCVMLGALPWRWTAPRQAGSARATTQPQEKVGSPHLGQRERQRQLLQAEAQALAWRARSDPCAGQGSGTALAHPRQPAWRASGGGASPDPAAAESEPRPSTTSAVHRCTDQGEGGAAAALPAG